MLIRKGVEEGPQVFEWQSRRKNGELFYSEISLKSTEIGAEGRVLAVVRDISDRKFMEQKVKESEEQYRTLVETSQDGISLMELNGQMIFVNSRKAKLVGAKNPIELVGRNAFNLLTVQSVEKVNSIMPELIQKGYLDNFEAEVRRLDGSAFTAEFNATVLYDSSGNPKYLMDTMRDISERKQTQKALHESQQVFQTLSQMSPVGIFRTNSKGHFTYVNPRWTELSGFSFEEAANEGWLKSVHPDDREHIKNIWSKCIIEKPRFREEFRYLKKNGEITWVIGIAVPEIINDKFSGFIGTNTNVTKRTLAQIALKQSEEKYRTLAESLNGVIMMVDNDDRVLFVNKRFSEVLGYSPDEIIGRVGYEVLVDHGSRDVIIGKNQSRKRGEASQYEVTFKSKAGENIDFLISGAPIKDSSGDIIGSIGAMKDITQRNRTAKELERYKNHLEFLVKERTEELETANEELHNQREELEATLSKLQSSQRQLINSEKMASLGVLASGIAHEINNPLNFIHGGIAALDGYVKENFNEHSQEVASLLEIMNTGVQRAVKIVRSLDHYTQKNNTRNKNCNVHSIIDDCLLILSSQLKNRIKYFEKPFLINCNEGKIHQAMLNILANAAQSISGQGIIGVKTQIVKNMLQIAVSDNGCGIPPENLKKVTDPFFTTKEPGEGTGLGLSITQNII